MTVARAKLKPKRESSLAEYRSLLATPRCTAEETDRFVEILDELGKTLADATDDLEHFQAARKFDELARRETEAVVLVDRLNVEMREQSCLYEDCWEKIRSLESSGEIASVEAVGVLENCREALHNVHDRLRAAQKFYRECVAAGQHYWELRRWHPELWAKEDE